MWGVERKIKGGGDGSGLKKKRRLGRCQPFKTLRNERVCEPRLEKRDSAGYKPGGQRASIKVDGKGQRGTGVKKVDFWVIGQSEGRNRGGMKKKKKKGKREDFRHGPVKEESKNGF